MYLNISFAEGKQVRRISDGMIGQICPVIPKYLYGGEYLLDMEIHVQFGVEEVCFSFKDAFKLL